MSRETSFTNRFVSGVASFFLLKHVTTLTTNQKAEGSNRRAYRSKSVFFLIKKKNLLSATLTFYQDKIIIR